MKAFFKYVTVLIGIMICGVVVINLLDMFLKLINDVDIFYISSPEKYIVYSILFATSVIVLCTHFIISAIKK